MLGPGAIGHLAERERDTGSSIMFRLGNGAIAQEINGKIYLDMTYCRGASPLPSPVNEQRQILAGKILEDFLPLCSRHTVGTKT
ncbi:hypothetical protein RFN28_20530 [Mesorhizobium sp. VK24D]|uniref:Uncharacterized protein n=2 Tax=Mesorhizobium TaxID=68287 RepID=A0ABU4ZRN0_9HYPH|nr:MULTISPECIES: hypothetical protein [unclassified Mesorhizobium]MDX8480827.1 hypothetical protein [Mesorhizobium sp. VK24D]MDX8528061.1 hypothetical protein [Mesorhizobium sp. MSK_1335]